MAQCAWSFYIEVSKQEQLEQLERLYSDDPPPPNHLMITHIVESNWIPSQKKTKSKLQI